MATNTVTEENVESRGGEGTVPPGTEHARARKTVGQSSSREQAAWRELGQRGGSGGQMQGERSPKLMVLCYLGRKKALPHLDAPIQSAPLNTTQALLTHLQPLPCF